MIWLRERPERGAGAGSGAGLTLERGAVCFVVAESLEGWADAVEGVLRGCSRFGRVRILRETASTQDAARQACGGEPGLVLAAGRQTAGRGRLGRVWHQHADMGLAVTFVARAGTSDRLSMAAGLAAHDAAGALVPGMLGIKAPNDLVTTSRCPLGGGRKVGGVLVEQSGGVALVGIGMNILQGDGDFAPPLDLAAASLAMLGARTGRLEVLCLLVRAVDARLGEPEARLAEAWRGALVSGSGPGNSGASAAYNTDRS